MEFGEKLKELRQKRNMTQEEVALSIGVSRRAYIAYEQENTRPRKQETYEKLAKTLGCDVNYLRIDDTAIDSVTATVLATLGIALGTVTLSPLGVSTVLSTAAAILGIKAVGKKIAERTEEPKEALPYSNDTLLQYERTQKLFAATAMGIIYKAAAEKGIQCLQGNLKDIEGAGNRPDEYIIVKNREIEAWWLVFWAKDTALDGHMIVLPDVRAGALVSRFTTAKSDPKRMATIVVDDSELYEAVCRLKKHNSYRGNLSVVLVDTNEVRICKETIISLYDDNRSKGTAFLSVIEEGDDR